MRLLVHKLVVPVWVVAILSVAVFHVPAIAQENPDVPYGQYLIGAALGSGSALVGTMGGFTVGALAAIALHPEIVELDDPEIAELRPLFTMIFLGGAVGTAAGAAWGVDVAVPNASKGNKALAFVSALALEGVYFYIATGGRDVFKLIEEDQQRQRYSGETSISSQPEKPYVIGFYLTTVVAALLGYHLGSSGAR